MYSYGTLTWPKDDDPRFEREEDAVKSALQRSREVDKGVYGIWDDESGELLCIVYEGWEYRP